MLGWEVIPRIPLGNLSVSPHGIGIAVGYFLGATLMARRARRTGFDEDHAWNAAVVGVLGAIVGARVAYIIGHSEQFRSPVEYLQIYKGGISLMGGLIGGFLAAYLYCRAKKLDFPRLADLGAPGLAIGTAVGRIGDLVIGDHLGRPTSGFWGWEYQGGELISRPPCDPSVYPSPDGCIQPGMVVHQTALYDSIWALIIFFLLMRLDRKPRPRGLLVLSWAALYSAGRIVTDFTRVDKTWFGTGLTGSQLTAIAVLALSLAGLAWLRRAKAEPAEATPGAGLPASATEQKEAVQVAPAGTATEAAGPTEAGTATEAAGPIEAGTATEAAGPTEGAGPAAEAGTATEVEPAAEVEPNSTPAIVAARPPGAAGVLTEPEEAAQAAEEAPPVQVVETPEVPAESDPVEGQTRPQDGESRQEP